MVKVLTLYIEFLKIDVGFLSLNSLIKTLFLEYASDRSKIWSLNFLIQVYISCLNNFLVKSKRKAKIKTGSIKIIKFDFQKAIGSNIAMPQKRF